MYLQAQAHIQELLYWNQTDDRDTWADSVEYKQTKGQGLNTILNRNLLINIQYSTQHLVAITMVTGFHFPPPPPPLLRLKKARGTQHVFDTQISFSKTSLLQDVTLTFAL